MHELRRKRPRWLESAHVEMCFFGFICSGSRFQMGSQNTIFVWTKLLYDTNFGVSGFL